MIYNLLRQRKIFHRITWTFSNFYGFPFKYILGQKMSAFGFCISMVIKTNVVSNMFDQFWQCNFSSGSVLTLLRWKQNCESNLNKWMHFWCSWENCKYPNWIKIEACSFICISYWCFYGHYIFKLLIFRHWNENAIAFAYLSSSANIPIAFSYI